MLTVSGSQCENKYKKHNGHEGGMIDIKIPFSYQAMTPLRVQTARRKNEDSSSDNSIDALNAFGKSPAEIHEILEAKLQDYDQSSEQ